MKQLEIKSMPKLPYAVEEALNRLRINIGFCGRQYKKIMVTSSVPNEGKSFIAFQMWKMFSESGADSLLVDADMRGSVMGHEYDMCAESGHKVSGLSDYLATDLMAEEVLYSTNVEGGCIVPNSTNVINPSILLENGKLEHMFSIMSAVFDHIFIDSPPLNLVSDGERIGKMCDGAVLVARASSTPKELVRNSVRQLERADCPLLGVVLNRVETQGVGYYSKRYGGRYYGRKYGKYYGKHYGEYYGGQGRGYYYK